jgi:hypothetical protein
MFEILSPKTSFWCYEHKSGFSLKPYTENQSLLFAASQTVRKVSVGQQPAKKRPGLIPEAGPRCFVRA